MKIANFLTTLEALQNNSPNLLQLFCEPLFLVFVFFWLRRVFHFMVQTATLQFNLEG